MRTPFLDTGTYDHLIVGAGFAGAVLAERLAAGSGARVLVVDRRNHIGGNAYDEVNSDGVLIHRYGPHIFHTNSEKVFSYLSQFTQWDAYEHRVLASVDNLFVPVPINLTTLNSLYDLDMDSDGAEEFLRARAIRIDPILTSKDVVLSTVGGDLYRKFFYGYTKKQWGLDPSELDRSVTSRIPTRTNRDDRYFTDEYQCMPRDGYTKMFEKMLSHPNINLMLGTDFRDIRSSVKFKTLIYSGPVDEYFDHALGKLPYRSVTIEFKTFEEQFHQQAAVVNYPSEAIPYTRSTEYKRLTGQKVPVTTLSWEYPCATGEPFYPIPQPANLELYRRYQDRTDLEPNVRFVGRLGTYKYYNMDQVVAQALSTYDSILGKAGCSNEHPRDATLTAA